MKNALVQIKTCSLCAYFEPYTSYRLSVGRCLKRKRYVGGSYRVCEKCVLVDSSKGIMEICLKK